MNRGVYEIISRDKEILPEEKLQRSESTSCAFFKTKSDNYSEPALHPCPSSSA
jgi:hypothetical protein